MPHPRTCVLNVASGRWYPLGQRRLLASLRAHRVGLDVLAWTDEFPPGSPTHDQAPYAFKPFAFEHARRVGYDRAVWMDSSLIALRRPDVVLRWLDEHGCFLSLQKTHMLGEWISDAALEAVGMGREEALGLHAATAGLLALDFRSAPASEFLDRWRAHALDGVSFPGAWTNERGQASADPRVKGHRHDQAVAGALAWRLGLPMFRWSHSVMRHGEDYRLRERAAFQCKLSCAESETRGRAGSTLWRLRRKLLARAAPPSPGAT